MGSKFCKYLIICEKAFVHVPDKGWRQHGNYVIGYMLEEIQLENHFTTNTYVMYFHNWHTA